MSTDWIERVRAASDIAEVVRERLELKGSGRNLTGLCPFHEEKTASFNVDVERQRFHCFGCNADGDVFEFVQRIERSEFLDAAELLSRRAGIPMPEHGRFGERNARAKLVEATEAAATAYEQWLGDPSIGAVARSYLERRGIDEETRRRFRLGLSLNSWDALASRLRSRHDEETLVTAGLASRRTNGTGIVDRFRNRLMVPLTDGGQVVGFCARSLADADHPKYLNSPETPLYHKGSFLFAFDLARRELAGRDELIVVEGQFDAMALHQAGLKNAIATSGTALTPEQAAMLRRVVSRVVLTYDGDVAGQEAMMRALGVLLAEGLDVAIVDLPAADDPDTVIRKDGVAAWESMRARAADPVEFIQRHLLRRAAAQSGPGADPRAAALQAVVQLGARINDPVRRELLFERAEKTLGMQRSVLHEATQLHAAGKSPSRENGRSDAKHFEIVGASLSLAVFPQRGKAAVELHRTSSWERLAVDQLKLEDRASREAFCERVPEEVRAEALTLTEEAASQLLRWNTSQEERSATSANGTRLELAAPEPWPSPVAIGNLLADLVATLRRFLAFPEGADIAIALWIIHAHAFGAWSISPLLAICSPEKRCGKTTTLILVGALVPKPLFASNITPAALFRIVEAFQACLLIDEADTFLEDNEELRGILNSGHSKSLALVPRVEGDKDRETRVFSTWAPKCIAKIGTLASTLEDRSITIKLRRRLVSERLERLRQDRIHADCEPLRRQLARFAQDSEAVLREADPRVPDELNDRAADNWRSLLAIADLAGPSWSALARRAALMISGSRASEENEPGVLMLRHCRVVIREMGWSRFRSKDLLERLLAIEGSPWPEWRRGKPLTPAGLGRILGRFDIHPRKIRFEEGSFNGYDVDQFSDAFERYLLVEVEQAEQAPSNAGIQRNAIRNNASPVPLEEASREPRESSSVPVVPLSGPDARAEDSELAFENPAQPIPFAETGERT